MDINNAHDICAQLVEWRRATPLNTIRVPQHPSENGTRSRSLPPPERDATPKRPLVPSQETTEPVPAPKRPLNSSQGSTHGSNDPEDVSGPAEDATKSRNLRFAPEDWKPWVAAGKPKCPYGFPHPPGYCESQNCDAKRKQKDSNKAQQAAAIAAKDAKKGAKRSLDEDTSGVPSQQKRRKPSNFCQDCKGFHKPNPDGCRVSVCTNCGFRHMKATLCPSPAAAPAAAPASVPEAPGNFATNMAYIISHATSAEELDGVLSVLHTLHPREPHRGSGSGPWDSGPDS
ncbi:hypothetical protein NA57DRAFT_73487 [Rhizodiscina lignyota]|uniref:Uncharacterized protein n=1 Tax=Rhizodiscina lignyota TaxID=1504668 RepID=A0A9P4IMP1_9PEZI|nr:hypothetical protein NA57DRAFT_73487 [Rhizodiscina lignyota]